MYEAFTYKYGVFYLVNTSERMVYLQRSPTCNLL